MKVPHPNNPISPEIRAQQARIQEMRQGRDVSTPQLEYSSIANTSNASEFKSVDYWRNRLKATKENQGSQALRSDVTKNTSTVLLGNAQQPLQKPDNTPPVLTQRASTALSPIVPERTITTPTRILTEASNTEVRAIGQSLVSVFEKLLSSPPVRPVLSAPSTHVDHVHATELVLHSSETQSSLNHLRFPGDENRDDEMHAIIGGQSEIPWEPIFPRVERLDHLVFPEPRTKAELLLIRQEQANKTPKA